MCSSFLVIFYVNDRRRVHKFRHVPALGVLHLTTRLGRGGNFCIFPSLFLGVIHYASTRVTTGLMHLELVAAFQIGEYFRKLKCVRFLFWPAVIRKQKLFCTFHMNYTKFTGRAFVVDTKTDLLLFKSVIPKQLTQSRRRLNIFCLGCSAEASFTL